MRGQGVSQSVIAVYKPSQHSVAQGDNHLLFLQIQSICVRSVWGVSALRVSHLPGMNRLEQ